MVIDAETGRRSIISLAAAMQEPGWFTKMRETALEEALNLPYPQWEYTDAEAFPVHLAPIPAATRVEESITAEAAVSTIKQGTGSSVAVSLHPEVVAAGVVCTDLFSAMHTHEKLIHTYLGSVINPNENKFTALHFAYMNAGSFIYVPRNAEVTIPFRITRSSVDLERIQSVHTLVVAEQGARVTIVEDHEREGTGPVFLTHLVEVIAKAGADVQFTEIQNLGSACSHYALRRTRLQRDARIEWLVAGLGAQRSSDTTETFLSGDGSEAKGLMLFFAVGNQHFDIGVNMVHTGLHTNSDILARGVVGDKARGIYRALTHIARGARFTSAYQKENALLLSKEARTDAVPALTIDEDEVQAGHAATVGQIDANQLFYLMSRGLSRTEAIRIVVSGFFDPILQRVREDTAKEQLQQLTDRKMTR